ncbi:MAG TPA: PRC-barrel domain-containing protein [Candidatus Dormibacteraeota bacterium]|nr:PRC-barrel domain-containing protein [Candidatus Dormibacteraeota bacterium]
MSELSDIWLGSAVVSSDEVGVGTIVSLLVDADGFTPRALVVKHEESLAGRVLAAEKFFTTDEVVIPFTAVVSTADGVVHLSMAAQDVRRQPLYLSYGPPEPTPEEAIVEEGQLITGGLGLPNVEEVANKPDGQVEIDRGENVMLGTTGRRLGRVEDVLLDHGELIGVVIRPEGFFKRDVVLPIRFVNRADDMALFANLTESDIEQLKPLVDGEPAG